MSEPTNDGEPAFPTRHFDGMSLRDWFAGQALPAKIADAEAFNDGARRDARPTITKLDVANACYGYADAMLQARMNNV